MTNAIEVTKREMYQWLLNLKNSGAGAQFAYASQKLEDSLEAHMEALRQEIEGLRGDVRTAESAWEEMNHKHESLNQTADQRFRDLQLAEEANTKLQEIIRISGDELRHAQMLNRSYARQLVGTEESPAVMTILTALVDAQRIMTDYLVPDGVRARDTVKALLPVLDNQTLVLAMREFEEPKIRGFHPIQLAHAIGCMCKKCSI